eukprot:TRINITY_DN12678_c0_g1_i2.p2 TRINITY_DN12678_c0_g1~~TRINITY_DN12678_c0_g1_i2.p2  ORF type:complete len:145 (+),score=24.70 TRINITY_DN12678_c0_g1_i2:354-788(+)
MDDESAADGPRSTMYYTVVAGALGSLLETSTFPTLQKLWINGGVSHFGEWVPELRAGTDMRDMENVEHAFWYFTWVQQLAMSIIRAVRTGSAPLLRDIVIYDNAGCAFFCTNPERMRCAADPQTPQIREQLMRIATSSKDLSKK